MHMSGAVTDRPNTTYSSLLGPRGHNTAVMRRGRPGTSGLGVGDTQIAFMNQRPKSRAERDIQRTLTPLISSRFRAPTVPLSAFAYKPPKPKGERKDMLRKAAGLK
eukprot:GFYU01018321.1.p1 GENE.GFYU01018321.1~~GFYU01018321.1.p1  ORF type:complete len:114 (-),score=23.60 GFYU01018321.1:57-374(-)